MLAQEQMWFTVKTGKEFRPYITHKLKGGTTMTGNNNAKYEFDAHVGC